MTKTPNSTKTLYVCYRLTRKKCKQFKEQAEKQCEKRIKEYAKQQQKIEETLEAEYNPHSAAAAQQQQRPSTMLGEWKQRLWSSSQGNLKLSAQASATLPTQNGNHPLNGGGTKFSALVGGTISGARGTVQRRAQASKQARMQQHGGDFKVGEIEAGSGKRSVRSLHGVQRNSEVLYVGTFSNNGDPLKRGKIADVFDVLEEAETASDQEEGDGGRRGSMLSAASRSGRSQLGVGGRMMGQGTMSRAYSQPDFMAQHLREEEEAGDEAETEVSEEVLMQRPAGLFDRPMLGSLAFR